MCMISEQSNKSYNAKNQMNKQLLLDNSALTPFYSLKHCARFFSSGKNFFPQFHVHFIVFSQNKQTET